MTGRKRVLALAGVALVLLPACSRVERQNVDGVDCVVVKSPIGQPRHVDCDWPADEPRPEISDSPDLDQSP